MNNLTVTKFHIFIPIVSLTNDPYTSVLIQTLIIIDASLICFHKCCCQLNIFIFIIPHPTLTSQTCLGLSVEYVWICLNMFFCFSWIMSDCVHLFLSPARTGLLTSSYWNTIPILKSLIKSIFSGHPNRIILLLWLSGTQSLVTWPLLLCLHFLN